MIRYKLWIFVLLLTLASVHLGAIGLNDRVWYNQNPYFIQIQPVVDTRLEKSLCRDWMRSLGPRGIVDDALEIFRGNGVPPWFTVLEPIHMRFNIAPTLALDHEGYGAATSSEPDFKKLLQRLAEQIPDPRVLPLVALGSSNDRLAAVTLRGPFMEPFNIRVGSDSLPLVRSTILLMDRQTMRPRTVAHQLGLAMGLAPTSSRARNLMASPLRYTSLTAEQKAKIARWQKYHLGVMNVTETETSKD